MGLLAMAMFAIQIEVRLCTKLRLFRLESQCQSNGIIPALCADRKSEDAGGREQ